jgi:hypothetical protein
LFGLTAREYRLAHTPAAIEQYQLRWRLFQQGIQKGEFLFAVYEHGG